MASGITFTPRYWLQAGDETWYPAPWWADTQPLLDAFADPARARADAAARATELRRIVAEGGLVRCMAPDAHHPVPDPVRDVYAHAGIGHLLS
ncbi:hypothetical protein [Roseateles puraquae]|jgi:hypothetical protein|uniref:Uncharacterized protein n=1 Tax=Roseateles puraquae TaxID=431059 RepID=A0A254NA74_9BURK|nr:hypothetical protein [Roseateles puraquae]MDG0856521.1 hypothetical protein [Roseateles puraquae]OWR02033.1 hypothetical protein CDO81_22175 [Roseateles puraquae]